MLNHNYYVKSKITKSKNAFHFPECSVPESVIIYSTGWPSYTSFVTLENLEHLKRELIHSCKVFRTAIPINSILGSRKQ